MRLSEMIYTEEEYKKLEQERDFFKEQAILWRNDYKNEYEENRKLKEEKKIRKLTAKDYAKQCGVELYDNLDDIIEK